MSEFPEYVTNSPAPPPPPEPLWFENATTSALAWFRRNSPATEPTRWLAGVGSTLLLVAGVTMTIASWHSIGPVARLLGLFAIHALIFVGGEQLKRKLPDVARALAHLSATLFAATGIQLVSSVGKLKGWELAGGRWTLCCVVGGLAAVVALELQRKRWSSTFMRAEQVLAVCLAAAGAAALTNVPVGIVVAVLGAAFYSIRRPKEATALSFIAMSTSLASGWLSNGWGAGTATRLGVVGAALGWAAPLSALIACAVVFLYAHERRTANPKDGNALIGFALFGLLYNLIIGYEHAQYDLSYSFFTTAIWLGLATMATWQRERRFIGFVAAAAPVTLSLLLLDFDVDRVILSAALYGCAAAALLALILGRRAEVVRVATMYTTISAGVLAIFAAEDYSVLAERRLGALTFAIMGAALFLRGRLESRVSFEISGALLVAAGLVMGTSTFAQGHEFDTLALCAVIAAIGEFAGRSRRIITTRFPYLFSAGLLGFYLVAGPLIIGGTWRYAMAVGVSVAMVALGVFSLLNTVTMIGIASLIGSLVVSFGPTMARMPVWVQFAAGGAVLIGAAVVVERRRELARSIAIAAREEALTS